MRDVINYDLKVDEGCNYKLKLNELLSVTVRADIFYDTEANWNRQIDLIAKQGGIYVYSDHAHIEDEHGTRIPVPALKVGDGTSYLIDMPFVGDAEAVQLVEHINNRNVHLQTGERDYWNQKVTAYVSEHDSETLMLSPY